MKKLITYILFILTASCAAPPTKEEISNLDYGSCPTGYVEKIKSHFQSGFLVAYKDEPIIWPPQNYWYQDNPLMGGKLYAGYLVPVMVHQIRGNPQRLGKHLYGFLFKNDELVKIIPSMDMAMLTISEKVGPLPIDKRGWSVGHSAEIGNQAIVEWVLPGEKAQNWSELITLQTFHAVSWEFTPEKLAKRTEESFKKDCAHITWTTVLTTRTEAVIERATTGCAPLRDEYSIEKFFRGPKAMHRVAYTKTSPLSDTERKKWTALIKRTSLMGDCT